MSVHFLKWFSRVAAGEKMGSYAWQLWAMPAQFQRRINRQENLCERVRSVSDMLGIFLLLSFAWLPFKIFSFAPKSHCSFCGGYSAFQVLIACFAAVTLCVGLPPALYFKYWYNTNNLIAIYFKIITVIIFYSTLIYRNNHYNKYIISPIFFRNVFLKWLPQNPINSFPAMLL